MRRRLLALSVLAAPRVPGTQYRYAPATGCFALRSLLSGKLVMRPTPVSATCSVRFSTSGTVIAVG
jgi:hypothetical protein